MSTKAPWDDAGCSPSLLCIHKDAYTLINKAWTYMDTLYCWCLRQCLKNTCYKETWPFSFIYYPTDLFSMRQYACLEMQTSQRIYPWINLCMQKYALKSVLKETWTRFCRPHTLIVAWTLCLKTHFQTWLCCITSNTNVWINQKS